MPKKFAGENSKAVVAKARKAAIREAEAAKKQKEIEDEYWKDDDKHNQRKLQRKEDKERKRQEQLEKKAETKTLIEQEIVQIAPKKVVPEKISRAQIELQLEKGNDLKLTNNSEVETHLTKPIEENVNRLIFEGESARTVDEAISILRLDEKDDKQNERKLKAAFTEFETTNLPRIKAENPTLRLSQIKQILRKEWMRSSENPVNKRFNS